MTNDIARFEREIAVERAALLANLVALEDRARALADWRAPIRQRPLEAVGVALAGGLVLGYLGWRGVAAVRRADRGGHAATPAPPAHPMIDRFVTVFAAVAAEAALAAVRGLLPGAKDEAAGRSPVGGNGTP